MSSIARPAGRRYLSAAFDGGFSRLSRIDEEQPMTTGDTPTTPSTASSWSDWTSSSQSTPGLPPFPSPPVFASTTPPVAAAADSAYESGTPPLPPPPPLGGDYGLQTSLPPLQPSLTSPTVGGDDATAVGKFDGALRELKLTCPADERDSPSSQAAVRFIKEKYDSLGKVRVDRPPTATVVSSSAVGDSAPTTEMPVDEVSYDVPTPASCSSAVSSMTPTVGDVGRCCCERRPGSAASVSVQLCSRHQQCASEAEQTRTPQQAAEGSNRCSHSQPLRQQHHQSCQHHQNAQPQQQSQRHSGGCAGGCPHQFQAHSQQQQQQQQGIPDVVLVRCGRPDSTVVASSRHVDAVGQTSPTKHPSLVVCCRQHQQQRHVTDHQHHLQEKELRQSYADSPPVQQRAVEHPLSRPTSTAGSVGTASAGSESDGVIGELSSTLTEHEVNQIDLFYRSHKTLVHVCSTAVRMTFSLPSSAAESSASGGSGRGAVLVVPPSSVDERNWSPTPCAIGVPVIVFDSGSGRRRRCLSLVLAERGTGFDLWRTTIGLIATDYFRGTSFCVPDSAAAAPVHDGASPVYHVVRERFGRKERTKDKDDGPQAVRWARLAFGDRKSADEFANLLEHWAADIGYRSDGGRKSLMRKSESFKTARDEKSTQLSRPNRKKAASFSKADISQPCCFSHVTRIERSEAAAAFGSSATAGASAGGLRGILRNSFGGAVRGLAGNDVTAAPLTTSGGSLTSLTSLRR